jgi:hypothetical protein
MEKTSTESKTFAAYYRKDYLFLGHPHPTPQSKLKYSFGCFQPRYMQLNRTASLGLGPDAIVPDSTLATLIKESMNDFQQGDLLLSILFLKDIGYLSFGQSNSDHYPKNQLITQLFVDPKLGYYGVALQGFSMNGIEYHTFGANYTTYYTTTDNVAYFPNIIYLDILNMFRASCRLPKKCANYIENTSAGYFNPCLDNVPDDLPAEFWPTYPTLLFNSSQGTKIPWSPQHYFQKRNGTKSYCLSFSVNNGNYILLGQNFLIDKEVHIKIDAGIDSQDIILLKILEKPFVLILLATLGCLLLGLGLWALWKYFRRRPVPYEEIQRDVELVSSVPPPRELIPDVDDP